MIAKIYFLLTPLSCVPLLFAAYRQRMNVRSIALKATVLAFLVALAFVFLGPLLFQAYGISLDSFKVAGGLVTLLLGLSTTLERRENLERGADSLVSLIATPLLTGPATLSFIVLKSAEVGVAVVAANLVFSFALAGATFIFIAFLIPNINLQYIRFLSRLLGLFLIGLGVEMMAAGVKALLF